MPAFYARSSGLPVDARADSAEDVAKIARARRELDMQGAVLVTVPVPAEAEVPAETVQGALDKALKEAKRKSVSGRELTPYLLSRLAELTDGATLKANVALLENNARVATQIAQALVKKREAIGFKR
jgi:pseudouridine-5'-phosphate glycosidase